MNLKYNTISSIGPPRFAIAVHALICMTQRGCILSSAAIAGQVNTHATFLRRVMASLANAGLVEAKEGRDGGYLLKLPPNRIWLADVYLAMKSECTEHGGIDVDCGEAGKQVDVELEKIMAQAEHHMVEYLRQFSIADVMKRTSFFSPPCEGRD